MGVGPCRPEGDSRRGDLGELAPVLEWRSADAQDGTCCARGRCDVSGQSGRGLYAHASFSRRYRRELGRDDRGTNGALQPHAGWPLSPVAASTWVPVIPTCHVSAWPPVRA